jgi:hypothetical protein
VASSDLSMLLFGCSSTCGGARHVCSRLARCMPYNAAYLLQLAAVCEQQQAAGVHVETAHGQNAPTERAHAEPNCYASAANGTGAT